MINKGGTLEILAAVFVTCIFIMVGSIYLYNRSENTAFHDLLGQYKIAKAERDADRAEVKSLKESIDLRDKKIKELSEKISCVESKLKDIKVDVDDVQEHCSKVREQQMQLRDQLSNKRPVIKMASPLSIQIVDQKTVNQIKKQLKEVSK